MKWEPIETAPKDVCVLVYHHAYKVLVYHHAYKVAHYNTACGRWIGYGVDTDDTRSLTQFPPTHWMPLPAVPTILPKEVKSDTAEGTLMSYRVEVKYFKPTGKFYSEGYYLTNKKRVFEIFDEFRQMLREGKRPGLVDGHSGFTAILEPQNHPEGYPAAFIGEA